MESKSSVLPGNADNFGTLPVARQLVAQERQGHKDHPSEAFPQLVRQIIDPALGDKFLGELVRIHLPHARQYLQDTFIALAGVRDGVLHIPRSLLPTSLSVLVHRACK